MSLGQIIRKKREQFHLTLDEVANAIGFSKPYLSTIETGKVKNPPSDDLLAKLEKILQFDLGQLIKIAHLEKISPEIRQEYESAEAENKKLRMLVKNISEQKNNPKKINSIIKKSKLRIDRNTTSLPAGRLVPIINKVAAGYPADFEDLEYPVGMADDYVRCPDLHDPNAFAVRVIGDSMEPKFSEGDIVVFSPATEVHNGDDCFIRFATPHETTFKRVFFEPENKIRLQPRNENYSPLIVDGKRINGLYRAVIKYEKL